MDKILENLPRINDPIKERMAEDKNSPLPVETPPAEAPPAPPSRDFFTPPKKKEPSARFKPLRQALNQTLMPDGVGKDMLLRQMQIMDSIFGDAINAYAHCPYGDEDTSVQTHRLTFALRLQNQCLRTARSLSAMEYMRELNSYNAQNVAVPSRPPACGHGDLQKSTPAPSPPVLDEQKEDGA